ncbi:MAG: flagellar biosynthesis protein FlhB [Alphaproteobacteria bacterium]
MAEDQDDSSKTEDPTPKRQRKAREKGQVAQSQEIKHWAALLGASFGLTIMAPDMANGIRELGVKFIEGGYRMSLGPLEIRKMMADVFVELAMIMWPFMTALVLIAIISNVGQFGLIWAPSKIKPQLNKLDPIKGSKKIISIKGVIEFAKGVVKIIMVCAVGYVLAFPFLGDVTLFAMRDLATALDRVYIVAIWFTIGSMGVMTAVALLDFSYQKYSFNKQMKMTKQEVKDELKQSEGDPLIKARIRKIRVERAQQRMMAAVPEADVVITNPTHYAIALKYKMDDMQAPILIAKGIDSLAFRIREVAEANDVPIVENPPLARVLYANVELDEEIPAEQYMAVAEVIGYVMRMRGELPPQESQSGL